MTTVVMHNVVSVDGYIADDNDDVGPLFEWYFNGDVELVDGGPFKVSQASADYVRPMWDSIGSLVIGRHLLDLTNRLGGRATGRRAIIRPGARATGVPVDPQARCGECTHSAARARASHWLAVLESDIAAIKTCP